VNAPIREPRKGGYARTTKETRVDVELVIDGTGTANVDTGIGFLDHLLGALAKHARFDLTVRCKGDLETGTHHTSEDVALGIGHALDAALADRTGIRRFGHAYAPLDEALVRAVVDLSGRPCPVIYLGLTRERIGTMACEDIVHVLQSLAIAGRMSLHVDVLKGDNDHHRAEAAFKACALALRAAVERDGDDVPSTKGVL
jgi:imidazoleglycerol phosphate dehydratase HisB